MKAIGISFVSIVLLSILIANLPVEYGLAAKYILEKPTEEYAHEKGGEYTDHLPLVHATYGELGFPLVLTSNMSAFNSIEELTAWVKQHSTWLNEKLYEHGGIVFRGFSKAIQTPSDFETLALTLEPNLEEHYLGTSTRTTQTGTRVVHSASDYPGWRIIPSHLEMSFLPQLPQRIFFYAHVPNDGPGGETPLVDFRQVYRDIHPNVLHKFKHGKIKYIRKYHDAQSTCFNYFIHKDWKSMFKTHNATLAGELAAKNGFEWSFEHGTMKLVHVLPATRTHPITNDEIWSNHMNVLHASSVPAEFAFSAQHLRSWKYVLLHHFFNIVVYMQSYWFGGADEIGHHVTHETGEKDQADVDHIKQMVWKNTIIYKHRKGDVAMLDNWRIGHGRQPYSGKRVILTAWH